jgi:hypothetical protein
MQQEQKQPLLVYAISAPPDTYDYSACHDHYQQSTCGWMPSLTNRQEHHSRNSRNTYDKYSLMHASHYAGQKACKLAANWQQIGRQISVKEVTDTHTHIQEYLNNPATSPRASPPIAQHQPPLTPSPPGTNRH